MKKATIHYRVKAGPSGKPKARKKKPISHYGQANTLNERQYSRLLAFLTDGKYNEDAVLRDIVLAKLSYNCGLRVCEMAGIQWEKSLLDADGHIVDVMHITPDISKRVCERYITLRPDVKIALRKLRDARPDDKYVIYSLGPYRAHSKRARSLGDGQCHPNSLTQYWKRIYRAAKLEGCSSHSGRRTFITVLARRCNDVGGSMRDVQLLAGHASLETTQGYTEPMQAGRQGRLLERMF